MADDVKVKFSGDFSEVPKGAQAAVSKAGSAMSSWFREYGKSIESSILGGLAASAVFGALKDNVSHALEYFRELDLTIRRVGGSSADFQKLAGVGKQVGVSMEMVGRSVNFLNKYLGQAAQGSKSHQQSLSDLGFTTDEIANGTISAIEVISRLGDEYDRTGNDTIVAAKAMEMFGRSGASLIPIIKLGREELKEMTKDMKVYSEETIRSASETQKNVEKMQRSWAGLGKTIVEGYSGYFISQQAKAVTNQSLNQAQEGGGTAKQQAISASNLIIQGAEGSRTAIAESLKYLNSIKDDFGYDKFYVEVKSLTASRLEKALAEMDKIKPKNPVVEQQDSVGPAALSASSLQAIGGGDITSVLAGTSPMDQTAENTRQANIYLKTIAEKQPVEQVDGTAAH